jgi:hypothetical protein
MGEGSPQCKQVYYRSTFEKMAPSNRDFKCGLHPSLPRSCFGQNTSRIQDTNGLKMFQPHFIYNRTSDGRGDCPTRSPTGKQLRDWQRFR